MAIQRNKSPIKDVLQLFLTKHYPLKEFKISKFQSDHYRNVSTDPLGTSHRSLGICGAHFDNHWFKYSYIAPT